MRVVSPAIPRLHGSADLLISLFQIKTWPPSSTSGPQVTERQCKKTSLQARPKHKMQPRTPAKLAWEAAIQHRLLAWLCVCSSRHNQVHAHVGWGVLFSSRHSRGISCYVSDIYMHAVCL
jgi:hypothetical protein